MRAFQAQRLKAQSIVRLLRHALRRALIQTLLGLRGLKRDSRAPIPTRQYADVAPQVRRPQRAKRWTAETGHCSSGGKRRRV